MGGYIPFSLRGLGGTVVGTATGSALAWSGTAWADTVRNYGLAATLVPHFKLYNTTPSDGTTTRQWSPVLALGATAWINGTSSQTLEMGIAAVPSVGTTMSGSLVVAYSLNGGAWTAVSGFSIGTSGIVGVSTLNASTSFNGPIYYCEGDVGDGGSTGYGASSAYAILFRNSSAALVGAKVKESAATIWRCSAWDDDGAVADSHQFAVKAYPNRADVNNSRAVWRMGYRKGAGAATPTGNFATMLEVNDVGAISPTHGVCLPAFAVAGLPTATAVGQVIYVSNGDTGNKCLAMWDGSNWLRIVLGAAVAAS